MPKLSDPKSGPWPDHDVEDLAEQLYVQRMARIPRLTLEHQATVEAQKCLQVAREFWDVVREERENQ